jgi:hypothetical protein
MWWTFLDAGFTMYTKVLRSPMGSSAALGGHMHFCKADKLLHTITRSIVVKDMADLALKSRLVGLLVLYKGLGKR